MSLATINKRADHVTQGREWEIDLGSFFQSDSSRLSLALTLGAGKIDQVQLSGLETLFSFHL